MHMPPHAASLLSCLRGRQWGKRLMGGEHTTRQTMVVSILLWKMICADFTVRFGLVGRWFTFSSWALLLGQKRQDKCSGMPCLPQPLPGKRHHPASPEQFPGKRTPATTCSPKTGTCLYLPPATMPPYHSPHLTLSPGTWEAGRQALWRTENRWQMCGGSSHRGCLLGQARQGEFMWHACTSSAPSLYALLLLPACMLYIMPLPCLPALCFLPACCLPF